MKQLKVSCFLLTFILLLSFRRTTQAQTTLGQVRDKVDTRLVQLWNIILTRQIAHYQMYGHFFQGMITHGTIPVDGADTIPDNWGGKPTDQLTNWIDFWDIDIPVDLPMALVIDTYSGPLGQGFTATVYAYYSPNQTIYVRAKAVGPETSWRSFGWRAVP